MGIDLNRFKGKRDGEWLDWLSDDPIPASIRARMRAKAVKDASRPTVHRAGQLYQAKSEPITPSAEGNQALSIHITIPRFKKPQFKLPAKIKQAPKKIWVGSSILTIAGIGVAGFLLLAPNNKQGKEPATGVLGQKSLKPTFAYSLPEGDATNATGEVRYDPDRKVVNFTDSIGGVTITVSQQQLPEAMKEDTGNKVKNLAADFSATEVISTSNPTAYLGTSAKGPQTVIFSKKDLLIFIQSTKEIDNHDWAEYITKLQ